MRDDDVSMREEIGSMRDESRVFGEPSPSIVAHERFLSKQRDARIDLLPLVRGRERRFSAPISLFSRAIRRKSSANSLVFSRG
jgi:hypothetical protein